MTPERVSALWAGVKLNPSAFQAATILNLCDDWKRLEEANALLRDQNLRAFKEVDTLKAENAQLRAALGGDLEALFRE